MKYKVERKGSICHFTSYRFGFPAGLALLSVLLDTAVCLLTFISLLIPTSNSCAYIPFVYIYRWPVETVYHTGAFKSHICS